MNIINQIDNVIADHTVSLDAARWVPEQDHEKVKRPEEPAFFPQLDLRVLFHTSAAALSDAFRMYMDVFKVSIPAAANALAKLGATLNQLNRNGFSQSNKRRGRRAVYFRELRRLHRTRS